VFWRFDDLHPEDGESMTSETFGTLPEYYMASQSRRPGLEISFEFEVIFFLIGK
jgi:hypothetical protein